VLTQDLPIGSLFAHFADFVYYAHYKSHDEDTLELMDESLRAFRTEVALHLYTFNKTDFTTTKCHMFAHYSMMIRKFGSLLNGDTEVPERLHVGVKLAYKRTNKKGNWLSQLARNLDEYFLIDQLYHQTEQKRNVNHPIHGTPTGIISRRKKFNKEQNEILEVITGLSPLHV
jgi:hypothetical protein